MMDSQLISGPPSDGFIAARRRVTAERATEGGGKAWRFDPQLAFTRAEGQRVVLGLFGVAALDCLKYAHGWTTGQALSTLTAAPKPDIERMATDWLRLTDAEVEAILTGDLTLDDLTAPPPPQTEQQPTATVTETADLDDHELADSRAEEAVQWGRMEGGLKPGFIDAPEPEQQQPSAPPPPPPTAPRRTGRPPKLDADTAAALVQGYLEGETVRQLMQRFGVSEGITRRTIRAAGVSMRGDQQINWRQCAGGRVEGRVAGRLVAVITPAADSRAEIEVRLRGGGEHRQQCSNEAAARRRAAVVYWAGTSPRSDRSRRAAR